MDLKPRKISTIIFRKISKMLLLCSISLAILLTFPLGTRVMGGENEENYGIPNKIQVPCSCIWDTNITFGVIADTHVDATSCSNIDTNTKENQGEVHDLNIDCTDNNCLFVVHVGDIVDAPTKEDLYEDGVQQLVAFRQLWENDYPGQSGGAIRYCSDDNYDAYSEGNRIKFPVFPTTGNHDIGNCSDNYYKVVNYIADRIRGASGIIDSYKSDTYAWRVGRYYFIQLGSWAGSLQCGDPSVPTDTDKLIWLQNFLKNHVGDSGLGVLIFQHFGWDGFSKQSRWWTDSQRLMEPKLSDFC